MKLVFYSEVLNHHQSCVADEFYNLLGDNYAFVELKESKESKESKGSSEDFSKRPYLLRAWESAEKHQKAVDYALSAETCVFSGVLSLPFERKRLKRNLLTFDMDERPLKRGFINIFSPTNLKTFGCYWTGNWRNKPLYKLCCSAFTRSDYNKMMMFKEKCYKWGYFTQVDEDFDVEASLLEASTSEITPLMWCSRFLMLKHPELPVLMAAKLKAKGYKFVIDMYGDEGNAAKYDTIYPRKKLEALIEDMEVGDCVKLKGNRPNAEILKAMLSHSIFLFTSDRYEGWGAVANESMANGCVLVASDAIGSTPYLIKDTFNGFQFLSCSVDSMTDKVEWLLTHKQELKQMQKNAYLTMRNIWSPTNAANSLLKLIDSVGTQSGIDCGPCSKA